jgi:phage head maturation protease
MTKLYAEISKSEKQDDGTIKVWGFASSACVDSDGEVITADAMRAARAGYMAFGNVREMHDPKKAAGVAIDYDVQDDGRTWFGAHVVDPVAVLKVETGVYKGFSIGARIPAGGRDGKTIKSIDLREVSLVDRPANPEAVFTMFKADGGTEDDSTPPTEPIAKAGRRFSAATKAALKGAHSACKAANDALDALKYEDDEPDGDEGATAPGEKTPPADKADDSADLQKAMAAMEAEVEEIAKAAGLTPAANTPGELIKAALIEVLALRKRVSDLEARPSQPKGYAMAVTKSADGGGETNNTEVQPVKKADGTVDDLATLVKRAQMTPIRLN